MESLLDEHLISKAMQRALRPSARAAGPGVHVGFQSLFWYMFIFPPGVDEL